MPRRAFVNDLKDVCGDERFPKLFNVRKGDDDGNINFTYKSEDLEEGVEFTAMTPDVSDYPESHEYILYTDSANVPEPVTNAIENAAGRLRGYSIVQMLESVSDIIDRALNSPGEDPMQLDMSDAEEVSDDEVPFGTDFDTLPHTSPTPRLAEPLRGTRHDIPNQAKRMRLDLRAAKTAGFKVGTLGNVDAGGFACVACRVMKLGISEEALKAWGLRRDQYIVLLIHYSEGYRSLEQIANDHGGLPQIAMRVGLCSKYKPTLTDAIQTFSQTKKKHVTPPSKGSVDAEKQGWSNGSAWEPLFIAGPLNELLNHRLSKIINYRLSCSFTWAGAELFFNDFQGRMPDSESIGDVKYCLEDVPTSSTALPRLVTADHISDEINPRKLSFPLLAMQFLLRHLVRCTEFCLVCHCKVDTEFEALKPYVCSKPLCLYQYMSLGFGPSVEWEILSQPYVVDLLVSFCYASAKSGRLKDFPSGVGLQVPPPLESISAPQTRWSSSIVTPSTVNTSDTSTSKDVKGTGSQWFNAKFDSSHMELVFSSAQAHCPLRVGDWTVLHTNEGQLHCRVEEICMWPTVQLGEPQRRGLKPSYQAPATLESNYGPQISPAPTPPPNSPYDIKFHIYNQNFDDLSDGEKRYCIVSLLDTLPDVCSMRNFLLENQSGHEPSLLRWRQRIPRAALDVLRWIIASNRSCIIQVDKFGIEDQSGSDTTPEARVSGMGQHWVQFRFAQGAPDKEQRFINAVKDIQSRLKPTYPTIFAWHGSPLQNWHGIVREGLHFNDALHGRAFGDGVYMSSNYHTSAGYTNTYGGSASHWPPSKLRVSSAISLNEVVNAPAEFVSRSPHYVVKQLDWIQTRYLFVRCDSVERPPGTDMAPSQVYQQDPQFVATGETSAPITIPITAVSKCRRPSISIVSKQAGNKKKKISSPTDQQTAENIEADAASIVTDDDDLWILCSEDEGPGLPVRKAGESSKKGKTSATAPSQTDFVPGTLDPTTLPLLQPPAYAAPSATKALQRDLKATLNVQDSTPLHELGWYIERDLIENMYQWIVELHSFEPALPLAKDMKAHGLKSIVIELRFTANHPYSPPFVRVIRPRFLSFMQGGGGHVTAGGALCMELLTSSGWSAVSSIESVLLQVRMAMMSLEPKPARLSIANGVVSSYSTGEAIEAYKRACAMHGWEVPKGFDSFVSDKNKSGGYS